MPLLAVGLNHKTAPVALRERLAFGNPDLVPALEALRSFGGVEEAVIVSTCNRTELYCALGRADDRSAVEWLSSYRGLSARELEGCLYTHADGDAVRHVLRVASGLDSLVLGEPQILGQLKDAYRVSSEAGASGKVLHKLFQYAFAVAKRVRTDTAIGSSPVSVAFAAVRLAQQVFGDLSRSCALLVGAGDTIELCAQHLHEQGLGRMIIANRSLERAVNLAHKFSAYAITLDDLTQHLHEADVLITATASPQPVITRPMLSAALVARKRRPVFAVDIAVPRDIDPEVSRLEDVYLYTVDDLDAVIQENLRSRRLAAAAADEIISNEVQHYMEWLHSLDAVATIRALRGKAEAVRDELLERARHQVLCGEDPAEVLATLANQLTNKLTHEPTVRLREASGGGRPELLRAARELFDLG